LKKVFICIDDIRGKPAIDLLIKRLNISIKKYTIVSLNPCSSKMTRIIRAALKEYDKVIIITDTETRKPEEIVNSIRDKHLLTHSQNAEIIPVKPCIENWPCALLGLKNCEEPPCSEGPIKSLTEYWMKKHSRKYMKKYLFEVLREALDKYDSRGLENNAQIPESLKKFIEALRSIQEEKSRGEKI